ncbi:MAG: hypothetical protein ACRD0K_29555 [Egibacteraceae bacterium]
MNKAKFRNTKTGKAVKLTIPRSGIDMLVRFMRRAGYERAGVRSTGVRA